MLLPSFQKFPRPLKEGISGQMARGDINAASAGGGGGGGGRRVVACGSRRGSNVWIITLFLFFVHGQSLVSAIDFILLEEQPPGTSLGNIFVASGIDRRFNSSVLDQLKFTFLDRSSFLTVEDTTGILRTTKVVDREEICRHLHATGPPHCFVSVDLVVQPIQFFQILKINVEILDVNDHVPVFPEKRFSQVVSEATDIGGGFTIPAAVDLDHGKFGIRRYETKPMRGKFELRVTSASDDSAILRLVLKERLDRETETGHEVIVYAVDGGHPPLTGSMTVQVTVGDSNDNRPVFEQTIYEVNVLEDAAHHSVLVTIKATDLDIGANALIHYALSESTSEEYGNVFGINSTSGDVYLKDRLDHEEQALYHLTLLAYDGGPGSLPGQATLVIQVVDVNDNRPLIEASFFTAGGGAEAVENAPVESFVALVSVTDQDTGSNGEFDCQMAPGNEFMLERVHRSQYTIKTLKEFDRELQASTEFTLECRDLGTESKTSELTVRVEIIDENDHAPTFPVDLYSVSVGENNEIGVVILRVSAEDEDSGNNSVVTYKLNDIVTVTGLLRIEPETGVIRAVAVLDRELTPRLDFVVFAEDLGVPSQTGTVSVRIDIIDDDDQVPVFSNRTYHFAVEENRPAGTKVGAVSAWDADSDSFNSFGYFIRENSTAFRVDLWTGEISTIQMLDREKKALYELTIVTSPSVDVASSSSDLQPRPRPRWSSEEQSPSSTAHVIIHVTDVNDNAPGFLTPDPHGNTTIVVSSEEKVGTVVIVADVYDPDVGVNGSRLSYFISALNGSAVDGRFRVNSDSGEVRVDGDLRPFASTKLLLRLTVVDYEFPVLYSTVLFEIVIRKKELGPESTLMRGLVSGVGYSRASVVIVVGLALVIVVLVVVLVLLCIVRCCRRVPRRKILRRRFSCSTESHPPDVVVVRSRTEPTISSASSDLPSNDRSTRKKLLEEVWQQELIDVDYNPVDFSSIRPPPLVNLRSIGDQRIQSGRSKRLDPLSRFLGSRDQCHSTEDAVNTGSVASSQHHRLSSVSVQVQQPLVTHCRHLHADDLDGNRCPIETELACNSGSSSTVELNSPWRTPSSASRDDCAAKDSMKTGRYFTYEAVDGIV